MELSKRPRSQLDSDKERLLQDLHGLGCLWYNAYPTKYVAKLTSGKVSNGFANLSKLVYTNEGRIVLRTMVEMVNKRVCSITKPDAIVGPEYGGIIPATYLADEVRTGFGFWSKDGKLHIGDDVRRVWIIDDVLTTGKSIRAVMKALLKQNIVEIKIVVLVNRSGLKMVERIPVTSLLDIPMPVFDSLETSPWADLEAIRPKGNWAKLVYQK